VLSPFPEEPKVSPFTVSGPSLNEPVIHSTSGAPLQSASRFRLPGLLLPGASRGVPSLFATSALRSIHVAPMPRSSVHDVSHVLDGFVRAWPCGFVSPRCHVQGSPFRGFPSHTVVLSRRQPGPLAVVDRPLPEVALRRHERSPRPRGFAPCGNPSSSQWGLATDWIRSPPGFLLLRVFLSEPNQQGHCWCRP